MLSNPIAAEKHQNGVVATMIMVMKYATGEDSQALLIAIVLYTKARRHGTQPRSTSARDIPLLYTLNIIQHLYITPKHAYSSSMVYDVGILYDCAYQGIVPRVYLRERRTPSPE